MIQKYLRALFAVGALLFLESPAQVAVTNGGFAINLPQGWAEYKAPKALSDLINQQGELFLYTESQNAKLFVSRFKIPAGVNQAGFVAGYLDGARKSAKQNGMKLQEEAGTFKEKWPRFSYDQSAQEGTFVHTTSIFTEKLLYNVQIVGPQASRAQLLQMIDRVALRDTPMAAAVFQKGIDPRAKELAEIDNLSSRIGYLTGVALVAILIIYAVVKVVGGGRKGPPPLPPRSSVPPPLPPTA
jgi:hypothetical protein